MVSIPISRHYSKGVPSERENARKLKPASCVLRSDLLSAVVLSHKPLSSPPPLHSSSSLSLSLSLSLSTLSRRATTRTCGCRAVKGEAGPGRWPEFADSLVTAALRYGWRCGEGRGGGAKGRGWAEHEREQTNKSATRHDKLRYQKSRVNPSSRHGRGTNAMERKVDGGDGGSARKPPKHPPAQQPTGHPPARHAKRRLGAHERSL